MQVLSIKYRAKKYKWLIYTVAGFILFLIIMFASIFGQLETNSCDTTTSITQVDNKDMEQNAKNIYAHWKQKYNATPQATAGILGVLQKESNLNPNAVNASSGATGLAQWLGGRKSKLEELANKQGKDATNLGVQLDYLDQELSSSYYEKNKKIFSYTDVHEASKAWLMDFEGMSKNPEQWFLSQRYAFADHWFSVLGTTDPVSASVLENASQGSLNELGCASDPSYSGNDIVKTAETMKGHFYYVQSHPSSDLGSDLKNPNKMGGTDCSGFIWLALNKAGYKVPANMAWFTGSMASDAKTTHKYLKQINQNDAKAGDIVIVNQGSGAGNNGHTGILLTDWKGKDTKVIQQGGDTTGHVNEGRFGTSFATLLDGGDVVLARPVGK